MRDRNEWFKDVKRLMRGLLQAEVKAEKGGDE